MKSSSFLSGFFLLLFFYLLPLDKSLGLPMEGMYREVAPRDSFLSDSDGFWGSQRSSLIEKSTLCERFSQPFIDCWQYWSGCWGRNEGAVVNYRERLLEATQISEEADFRASQEMPFRNRNALGFDSPPRDSQATIGWGDSSHTTIFKAGQNCFQFGDSPPRGSESFGSFLSQRGSWGNFLRNEESSKLTDCEEGASSAILDRNSLLEQLQAIGSLDPGYQEMVRILGPEHPLLLKKNSSLFTSQETKEATKLATLLQEYEREYPQENNSSIVLTQDNIIEVAKEAEIAKLISLKEELAMLLTKKFSFRKSQAPERSDEREVLLLLLKGIENRLDFLEHRGSEITI